jgi:hypothetical protein
MNYYFLETRSAPGDPIAEGISIPASYHHFDLGRMLPKPKKSIRIKVSKGKRPPTDLIQGPYTYIIASERLRALFQELEPSNLEAVPVDLVCEARIIAQYHFIQVLNNIDAIDWSKSDLKSYPEDKYGIVEVRKLVLNPEIIDRRNVFRIEGLAAYLVVSGLFRERAVDAGMTGMRFVPTEEFTLS